MSTRGTSEPQSSENGGRLLLQRRRARFRVQATALVLVVGPALAFLAFEPWDAPVRREGRIIALFLESTGEGRTSKTRFLVRLADGRRIELHTDVELPYEQGQRLVVSETTSRYLGRRRYRLVPR